MLVEKNWIFVSEATFDEEPEQLRSVLNVPVLHLLRRAIKDLSILQTMGRPAKLPANPNSRLNFRMVCVKGSALVSVSFNIRPRLTSQRRPTK